MSDYLFDKQGEPDPEVARLEQLLSPLAYRGRPPRPPRRRARVMWISAGLLAVSALIALVLLRPVHPVVPPAGWAAIVRGGAASCDGHPLSGEARLPVGAWLETGSSRAQLQVADIGTVELAPGSRARIVETGARQHTMQLARGTLSARVDAPPRIFRIQTPRMMVIDLGCAFELTVDEAGRGQLLVTAGSVALSDGVAPEVVVPAGAKCDLTDHGPGTPSLVNAPTHEAPPPVRETPTPKAPGKPKRPAPRSPKAAPHASPVQPKPPTPARKSEPADKFKHDPFKDLP